MTGPGDELAATAGGPGYLRASDADRERVIDALQDAFMRGRLAKGELDTGLGRVLAARTYAELAAVIVAIPTGSSVAQPPTSARLQRSGNKPASSGVYVIAAATLAVGILAGVVAGVAVAVIAAILVLNVAAFAVRP
jgi:Domain of unknown function (DUF1707)